MNYWRVELFIIYIIWCFNLVGIGKVKMVLMIYISGKFEYTGTVLCCLTCISSIMGCMNSKSVRKFPAREDSLDLAAETACKLMNFSNELMQSCNSCTMICDGFIEFYLCSHRRSCLLKIYFWSCWMNLISIILMIKLSFMISSVRAFNYVWYVSCACEVFQTGKIPYL